MNTNKSTIEVSALAHAQDALSAEGACVVTLNLSALPRPLAAAVRYLAEQSWQTGDAVNYHTLPDAARMLGIPYSTLTLWVRKGKVRAIQVGKRQRVDVEDCRQYLINSNDRAAG